MAPAPRARQVRERLYSRQCSAACDARPLPPAVLPATTGGGHVRCATRSSPAREVTDLDARRCRAKE
eukprot:350597-Chlamydomonas_euryale.AAC.3